MKCYKHPQTDSTAFCNQCGRALCGECKHEVRGVIYCEECLAARMSTTGLPPIFGQGPSPGWALALSIVPGVGAAYNGQVMKGLLQLAVFIGLMGISQQVDIFGWAVAAWWIYVAIDSYQTARAKSLGHQVPGWFGLEETRMNVPLAAGLLIGLGVLLLLQNFGIRVFNQLERFWPVLLILFGLLLLQRRLGHGGKPPESNSERAGSQGPGNPSGPQGT